MSERVTKNCESCGKEFSVRLADHKRGWGRFCSKSCKATRQEQRTGQYHRLLAGDFGNFDNTQHQDHTRDEPSTWGKP